MKQRKIRKQDQEEFRDVQIKMENKNQSRVWDLENSFQQQEFINFEGLEEKKEIMAKKTSKRGKGQLEVQTKQNLRDVERNDLNKAISGKELINKTIDIIRHQQYLLDNLDHLSAYNERLLNVWKRQINLLDSFDRFEYYKLLGRLKELMKRLSLIDANSIESLLQENNKELIKKKEILIELLMEDFQNVNNEGDLKESFFKMNNGRAFVRCLHYQKESSEKLLEEVDNQGRHINKIQKFLDQVLLFLMKLMQFNEAIVWKCKLCGVSQENAQRLLKHCDDQHLRFLSTILQGSKDKCFSLNCNDRRGHQERDNYDFSNHLKWVHSQIYLEDSIFCKLYEGEGKNQQNLSYHYGKNVPNWKSKFEKDLCVWLEKVDPGAQQFLLDSGKLNKRGEGLLQEVRSWMENDQSLIRSDVEGAFGDFDQLCYLLKWSWNESKKSDELDWIQEKLCKTEPRRIQLIEAVAELLDTKQSLISQLHRYLYLGVFNFKLTQKELNSRINSLDKLIKDIGIFQRDFVQQKKSAFQNTMEMLDHYYDGHVGVFYALSSSQLQQNLSEKNQEFRENKQRKRENYNIFQEMDLNQIIHFLHDHHEADVKTRSKRFMRNCRKNFQLKSVCSECKRELHHLGEVYWNDEKLEKRRKPQLVLRHKQTVQEVIQVYQDKKREQGSRGTVSNEWSEIAIIDQQCNQFKQEMFEQMKSEVLIDDKGRKSQCKDCYKRQKGFNPLLKELKEEYFRLPEKEINNNNEDSIKDGKEQIEITDRDPEFIQVQKRILNRMMEEKQGGWKSLKEEMQSGYFRINSFPKLVQIYGDISEKQNQNPNRILSQPILTGYMKVLFQTPLIYIPGTSIIYEIQPQWAKIRHQFKLFGSSEVQRKEFIQMLESHPIIQNHTYQLSKLTNLCIDQVDLMFKLNKHLMKQRKSCRDKKKQNDNDEQYQDKISLELRKTADLLYFEGVLHRAQVQFLIQQFRIWLEVFKNVKFKIEQYVEEFKNNSNYGCGNFDRLLYELDKFSNKNNQTIFLELMLILGIFYLNGANKQMKFSKQNIDREIDENSSLVDFLLSENSYNPFRFIVESHILPIVIPLIEQFIHPIFIGTLLQIFQLNLKREIGYMDDSLKFYLTLIYEGLSKLTIKRCLPLFEFEQVKKESEKQKREKKKQKIEQEIQSEEEEEEDIEWKERKYKLEGDQRWFQKSMFSYLDESERIDMQCRYVLAKRSLLKALNNQREEPLIDCDLRWSMQVATIFYSSLQKRSQHGNDEEMRVALDHVTELINLKQEVNHYLNKNKTSIPEDFLFKAYNNKNGQEQQSSNLRTLLEEVINDDQKNNNLNQLQNLDNYSQIHRLKIAYFIPIEKKLQDIVKCIQKLRSLPHRQSYRSFEKFSRYNFRELEMLAFPEIFATGQGFQQYLAPKIERSQIVIEIQKQDRQQAQDALRNLRQLKSQMKDQQDQQIGNTSNNTLQVLVLLEDFTTQYRQGQALPIPKKAILSVQQEEYIKSSLSSAFVYDMQKVSLIKVFQEASQNTNVPERSFKLEQNLEIKITGGNILSDSLKEEHVLKNFKELLQKQSNWSNECQAFVKNLSEEAKKRRKNNQAFSLLGD